MNCVRDISIIQREVCVYQHFGMLDPANLKHTYKHPLLAHLPAFGVPKTSFHLGPFLAHRGGYVVLTFSHCVFNLIGHYWCILYQMIFLMVITILQRSRADNLTISFAVYMFIDPCHSAKLLPPFTKQGRGVKPVDRQSLLIRIELCSLIPGPVFHRLSSQQIESYKYQEKCLVLLIFWLQHGTIYL